MKNTSKILLSVFSIMLISATILFTNSCGAKKTEDAATTTEQADTTAAAKSDTAAVATPDTAR